MDNQEIFEDFREKYYSYFLYAAGKEDIKILAKAIYGYAENSIILTAALVTALNYHCWDLYHKGDEELSQVYSDLYYEYNEKAWDWLDKNGTEEEKSWYFHTMD